MCAAIFIVCWKMTKGIFGKSFFIAQKKIEADNDTANIFKANFLYYAATALLPRFTTFLNASRKKPFRLKSSFISGQ